MIGFAREAEQREPLGIDYRILDAADLETALDGQTFDVATSCLALQDMPDVPRVLRGVHKLLRPGGRFVVSITHPCTDTPFRRWERDRGGGKQWLCIDRYFERAPFQFTWTQWTPEPITTTAIHAPLEDWIAWCLSARFQLRGLREPMPTADALKAYPKLEDATRVPYYLFLDLVAVDI
jgi:SAM-dependent methyltransferase